MKTLKRCAWIIVPAILLLFLLEPLAFAGKGGNKGSGYNKGNSGKTTGNTPPGWERGKKTGWQGGKYPPGWSKWNKKKQKKWSVDRDEAHVDIRRTCERYRIRETKRNQISEAFDEAIAGGLAIDGARKKLVSALQNKSNRKKILVDTLGAVHDLLD